MSTIEIVIKEQLNWEEAQSLLHILDKMTSDNYTVLSMGVIDVPTVRDCLKKVCIFEE